MKKYAFLFLVTTALSLPALAQDFGEKKFVKFIVGTWTGSLTFKSSENQDGSSFENLCQLDEADVPPANLQFKIKKIKDAPRDGLASLTLNSEGSPKFKSDASAESGGTRRYRHTVKNKPARRDRFSSSYYFINESVANGVATVTVVYSISQDYLSIDPSGGTYCAANYEGVFTRQR